MRAFLRVLTAVSMAAAIAAAGRGPALANSADVRSEAAQPGDFNGDGHADLAIGSEFGDAPEPLSGLSRDGDGFISVVPGSRTGPDVNRRKMITQDTPGMPGFAAGHSVGRFMASADFDEDGYADLAVCVLGPPARDPIRDVEKSGVTIIYGSRSGLSARPRFLGPDAPSCWVLTAGDFDGDGDDDLFSGFSTSFNDGGQFSRWTWVEEPPSELDGAQRRGTDVAVGDVNGDGTDDLVSVRHYSDSDGHVSPRRFTDLYLGGSSGLATRPKTYVGKAGSTAAVGDVNGDGKADLIAGEGTFFIPQQPRRKTVYVEIRLGTAAGLGPAKTVDLHTKGLPVQDGQIDELGGAVASGDINDDGFADVAIGAPQEKIGGNKFAGAVTVLYGSKDGLMCKGSQVFNEGTPGVPGEPDGSGFGGGLALRDIDDDGKADLVIGTPGKTVTTADEDNMRADGAVTVLWGTGRGVTTRRAATFGGRDLDVDGRNAMLGRRIGP